MSLFKGKLFNGKLFNGLLFGPLDQELRSVSGYAPWREVKPADYDSEDLIDLIIAWVANE